MTAQFGQEAWSGGFYELAIEYEHASTDVFDAALKAIWTFPDLQGCYARSDEPPPNQPRVAPDLAKLENTGHLYGVAKLPSGAEVSCGTFVVREEGGSSWLGFYLPLGGLGAVYDIGAYPFDELAPSRVWREPLEEWLARIGQFVFAKAPFSLGLVGFEVSGTKEARDLASSGVPAKRSIGYLYPSANKLTWYPTNQWQPSSLLAS